MKFYLSAALLCSLSSLSFAKVEMIYGEDNRRDIYSETNMSLLDLSKSVAAMVHKNDLGTFRFLRNQSFQDMPRKYSMCSNERFVNQKSIANCSGSLIAADKILTAGHCVPTPKDCTKYRWVFDYKMLDANNLDLSYKNNVYSCVSILASSSPRKLDFAVIQLDRPVLDRLPLKVNFEKLPVSDKNELAVIGYPSGLPMKIADNAIVKGYSKNGYLANLDTYGGNSGSPVFNKSSGEIIGLLLEGQDDFIFDRKNKCFRSNVCNEDGLKCKNWGQHGFEYVGATAELPIAQFVEN